MKKTSKIALLILVVIILAITGSIIYIKTALPNVGAAPDLKIELTEARIKRGEYLSNAVTVCMDCHSTRDWTRFSGPLTPGTLGAGGEIFNQEFGFPGIFYSKNITPYKLIAWSDGEIFRAITSGVSKDGSPLFPVMPHPNYGQMDKEDIYSIIAYLRTLKPIQKDIPASTPDFPMNIILNTIPKPANFTTIPDKTNPEIYGKYLFNAAACSECHSKAENGAKIEGMELAGGFEFKMPGGLLISPNITQDVETGIGGWTEEAFLNKFKTYSDSNYKAPLVEKGNFNTVMPWLMYSKMTDEDLKALYAYLKTVKPIKNRVVRYTPNKN